MKDDRDLEVGRCHGIAIPEVHWVLRGGDGDVGASVTEIPYHRKRATGEEVQSL